MATSIFDGPLHVPGSMQAFLAQYFGSPVADPNSDAGPSLFYQGVGVLDPRMVYLKDKVQGYTGVVQAFQDMAQVRSVSAIPATLSGVNIVAGQNVVSGTPLTIAAASVGVTRNVPIRPFSNSLMGAAPVTAAVALDFGFAFGNCAIGNTTVTVADSRSFVPGMPLVIGGVGNAAGTIPLLTQVATIASATTITLVNAPLLSNATAPIGTGDIWGPSPMGFPPPLAAYPFVAGGPGLFLDPRQAIARTLSVTSGATSTGGALTVAGWDIYGMPMRETITVGAVATAYGKKAFKYIGSITPAFTDAHTYSVGTSDVFGFHFRASVWEDTSVAWNGTAMTAAQGFLAPDLTDPATATTGDVRGVIQTGAGGGGTGIGASASNGTVVGLLMSGRRLEMRQFIAAADMLRASPAEPRSMFGTTQF